MHTSATSPGTDRPRLRRRAFFAGQGLLGASRVGDLYGCLRGGRHAIVLMYHSICPDERERWIAPRNRISVRLFERQLRRLAETGRVIPLTRLAEAPRRPVPGGSIVITFDDGYLDNLEVAAPLLRKYRLPATLYLATGYVANAETQWADVLYGAFRHRQRDTLTVDGIDRFDLRDGVRREYALRAIGERLTRATRQERTLLLDDIRRRLGAPPCRERLTLDFDDVRKLKARYPDIEIGVHTADHLDLGDMDADGAIAEVVRSMDDLHDETGCRAEHFSFPYSRWNGETKARLGDIGLRTAMTGRGVVPLMGLDPFDLRRLETPASMALFRYWTSGAHPSLTQAIFGRP